MVVSFSSGSHLVPLPESTASPALITGEGSLKPPPLRRGAASTHTCSGGVPGLCLSWGPSLQLSGSVPHPATGKLDQWFSEYGSHTISSSITWELSRNANAQAPPSDLLNQTLWGWGPASSASDPRAIQMHPRENRCTLHSDSPHVAFTKKCELKKPAKVNGQQVAKYEFSCRGLLKIK